MASKKKTKPRKSAKVKKHAAKKKSSSAKVQSQNKQSYLGALLIAVLTFAVYWSSTDNDFTNWDDSMYVTENPNLELRSDKLNNILTLPVAANIHPVTMLTLAFDYTFLSNEPIDPLTGKKQFSATVFHRMSLVYHILTSLFFFWFLWLLSKRNLYVAIFGAAIFAVHPMHVESVSWISGRKDVVYGLFFIAAMCSYLFYLKNKNWWQYAIVLLLFALSVFAKAMAVVLPLVLLSIDWYKGRKIRGKVLIEKVPFFILSLIAGIMAYQVQAETTIVGDFERFNYLERMLFAFFGMNAYVWKFIIPAKLSAFYPYPLDGLLWYHYLAPVFTILGGVALWLSLKKTKAYVFGFALFLLCIVLVLQFLGVGDALMADRYSYLPYMGLSFMLAYGLNALIQKKKEYSKLVFGVSAAFVLFLAVLAFNRTKVWQNSGTLWTDVVEKYPNSYTGFHNLGHHYRKDLQKDTLAFQAYNKALELRPTYFECLTNRGAIYRSWGRYQEAIEDYNQALKYKPDYSAAISNRANAHFMLNNHEMALKDYERALKLEPGSINFLSNRGAVRLKYGQTLGSSEAAEQYNLAIEDFNSVLKALPGSAQNLSYRGFCHYLLGNYREALSDFNTSIKFEPNLAQSYFYKSLCNIRLGKRAAAERDAAKAEQLGLNISLLKKELQKL